MNMISGQEDQKQEGFTGNYILLPTLQGDFFGKNKIKNAPLRLSLIYFVFGFLWILLSDKLLDLIIKNKQMITPVQTYKGWFFIIATSIMLCFLLAHYVKTILRAAEKMKTYYQELADTQKKLIGSENQLREKTRELEKMLVSLTLSKEEVNKLAYFDGLTNMPNRTYFHKAIKEKIFSAGTDQTSFALMFLDLDNFKAVNDTLGHFFGDRLLASIADRIKAVLPENIPLYRFGGDEFIVIYSNVESTGEVAKIAERIFSIFTDPLVVEGRKFYLTISMGISLFPEDGAEEEVLLRKADNSLHQAKKLGKNKYLFYSKDMEEEIFKKVELEHKLRAAIENEELIVYYQPIMETESEKINAMEALIRWNQPGNGVLNTAEFIELAEETDLIVQIDNFVIKSVCQQLMKWKEQGLALYPISINLSGRQFNNNGFLDMLKNCTGGCPEFADLIEFEITESTAMNNLEAALKILNEIKKQGFRILLDDFGTGYSSLNYLRFLPINTLKIDKSFIRDIGENKEKKMITETILSLAHKMNLDVVAEGVETREQLAFLKEHNCTRVQGYIFSKALPPEEIERQYL